MAASKKKVPKKSLRSILMLWFLLFAVVPLAFITGYSVVKFEQAIDQELAQRLVANSREISSILHEYETALSGRIRRHAFDPAFVYALATGANNPARSIAMEWMKVPLAQQLNVFDRYGRQVIAVYRDSHDEVQHDSDRENKNWGLNSELIQKFSAHDPNLIVDFNPQAKSIDLIAYHRVQAKWGLVAGYIEEVISLNETFLAALKRRLGIEVLIFNDAKKVVVASHPDLYLHSQDDFFSTSQKGREFFDFVIEANPYGFLLRPVKWGEQNLNVLIGASKREAT